MSEDIVIVGLARTPMGGLLGELSNLSAPELGAVAVKAAMKEAKLDSADQIIMGNVLSAGQGQAPARQAALKAGLSKATEAVTLNKMCGSGLQAVAMARQALLANEAEIVIAGGMESMSRAPFLMTKHRGGQKYGHDKLHDHMALDGLEDAYEGLAMGVYADQSAKEYQFTRETQDQYALETLSRAQSASNEGRFKREIAPVETKAGVVDTDELPRKARPEKIPSLKPAFTQDGTVTAANASAISDGAAALVLMRASDAKKRGLKPIARIVAQSSHAQEPSKFTSAPVPAIKKALDRAGWKASDVDLWEINEAFAVVPLIAMRDL
ncbi:MAG: acetyl-CoA C-acyltransferase, partial [Hyphomonadaceae bacterium]